MKPLNRALVPLFASLVLAVALVPSSGYAQNQAEEALGKDSLSIDSLGTDSLSNVLQEPKSNETQDVANDSLQKLSQREQVEREARQCKLVKGISEDAWSKLNTDPMQRLSQYSSYLSKILDQQTIPKGNFEKTADYEARLAEAKQKTIQWVQDSSKIYFKYLAWENFYMNLIDISGFRKIKTIRLPKYDADSEIYSVFIDLYNGRVPKLSLRVTPQAAQSIKWVDLETVVDEKTGIMLYDFLDNNTNNLIVMPVKGLVVDGVRYDADLSRLDYRYIDSLIYRGTCIWPNNPYVKDVVYSYSDLYNEYQKNLTALRNPQKSKSVKSVKIGKQTWMKQNVNHTYNRICLDNKEVNCKKYGGLYDRTTALLLPPICAWKNVDCAPLIRESHQGICPEGWHIPTSSEWLVLADFVGENPAIKLKAKNGWKLWGKSDQGTDQFGFSALPGGCYSEEKGFCKSMEYGAWWRLDYDGLAGVRSIESGNRTLQYGLGDYFPSDRSKVSRFSVRCVKDLPKGAK